LIQALLRAYNSIKNKIKNIRGREKIGRRGREEERRERGEAGRGRATFSRLRISTSAMPSDSSSFLVLTN
jgi:hypothetical protein